MKTLTQEMQAAISPNKVLSLLEAGNQRLIGNLKINRNLLQQANETSNGQHPFVVVFKLHRFTHLGGADLIPGFRG